MSSLLKLLLQPDLSLVKGEVDALEGDQNALLQGQS